MSLEAIFTRIKEINAGIQGVTRAYDHTDLPASLGAADLPAVISFPHPTAPSPLSYSATELARIEHHIVVRVYVAPVAKGTLAQNLAACLPFIKRFRDRYAQAMRLDDLEGIEVARLTSYRIGLMPDYSGTDYVGVEFEMEVVEKEAISVGT